MRKTRAWPCRNPRHARAVGDLAGEDLAAEVGLDLLLEEALQRARTVDGIVAGVGEVLLRAVGELELDLALAEALADTTELDLDDALQLLAREAVEDDDLVDPVQELGTEVLAQRGEESRFISS